MRPSIIEVAVWSPCNRFIAITWGNTATMDILDSATLHRLQTLESQGGINEPFRALAFSPDSRILTSTVYRGEELFVESWDLQTGGVASILRWREPRRSLVGLPSITYSANGKMAGVFYYHGGTAASIFICDVASGVRMHSHSFNSGVPLSNQIWTHEESLRFATAEAAVITIWEVGFIVGGTPTKAETLLALDESPFSDSYESSDLLFLAPTDLPSLLRAKFWYGTFRVPNVCYIVWTPTSIQECPSPPTVVSSHAQLLDQPFISGRSLPLAISFMKYSHAAGYALVHSSPKMENQLSCLSVTRSNHGV